ncbi:TPA: conjugal transfer protein, partial [Clostridioides difficile]
DLDEAWSFLQVAQGKTLSMKLVRASQDSQDKRIERLKNYLTENLQQLNTEMVRSYIPTSSIVNSFLSLSLLCRKMTTGK